MSSRRFLWILAAALFAIAGAYYVGHWRHATRDLAGSPLLPALGKQLNEIDGLTIRKGGALPSVSLRKQGGRWTVAERGDYPADMAKLRKLILALSGALIIEAKTSDPANYHNLGLDEPSDASAAGAEITLSSSGTRQVLIVGKPTGAGNFVRFARQTQSYLVEPGISFETQPRYWVDARLLDIAPALIQRLEIKPAAGPAYAIHRTAPGDFEFALDTVPAGRSALDAKTLAPSGGAFNGLVAEDIAAAGDIDFKTPSMAVVTLSDGRQITLTGSAAGEKRWLALSAVGDPALSDRVRGRAFEIASFRYEAIFRPLEQLLAPKPKK